jgi:hypothetical protein
MVYFALGFIKSLSEPTALKQQESLMWPIIIESYVILS